VNKQEKVAIKYAEMRDSGMSIKDALEICTVTCGIWETLNMVPNLIDNAWWDGWHKGAENGQELKGSPAYEYPLTPEKRQELLNELWVKPQK
jgi:hypothetical protein